jgi:hypothetical protein
MKMGSSGSGLAIPFFCACTEWYLSSFHTGLEFAIALIAENTMNGAPNFL